MRHPEFSAPARAAWRADCPPPFHFRSSVFRLSIRIFAFPISAFPNKSALPLAGKTDSIHELTGRGPGPRRIIAGNRPASAVNLPPRDPLAVHLFGRCPGLAGARRRRGPHNAQPRPSRRLAASGWGRAGRQYQLRWRKSSCPRPRCQRTPPRQDLRCPRKTRFHWRRAKPHGLVVL
jgi:hypothetical protein